MMQAIRAWAVSDDAGGGADGAPSTARSSAPVPQHECPQTGTDISGESAIHSDTSRAQEQVDLLALRSICKSYRSGLFTSRRTIALHAATMSFKKGEVTGIVGPNGAGKSTLLKLASGIIPPDYGTIRFRGEAVSGAGLRRRVGYVSNHLAPYPKLSVRQNLEFRGRIGGMGQSEAAARAESLAAHFDLVRLLERKAGVLSTGEGQKLRLCSAMVLDPEILVLDEPTTGLDIIATAALFEVMEELKKQGRALVFCSHSPAELERLCDRFCILKQGRLTARPARGTLGTGEEFERNLLALFGEENR